jgi:signal transduction histidine kinase
MRGRRQSSSPLGLRSRLTVTFALVTLGATLLVSATTFLLSKRYLVEQRERAAIRQTFLNARLVRDLLQSGDQEPQAVLDSSAGEAGTLALLRVDGQWYASGVAADPALLPASLIEVLNEGDAGHQRVTRAGRPRLVVGIPLAERNSQYLEIIPLDALERTFRTLLISLLIGSVGTTIAGTIVGVYASRRLLRPLQRMSVVAAGITAGDLHARLDAQGDRDLETLVNSFNEMVSALQERIEREQRFASDVSHELRTPLTVLKAAVQLVEQRSPDLSPRALEAVEMLAKQVGYFERLVLDLLEISRFDAGVEQPDLEETDLVAFLNGVSHDLGGPPVTTVAAEPIRMGVDRRRMERILGNLIENADRYAGGVDSIRIDPDTDHVEIHVVDRGAGIPADERDHIFDRFWRGRNARHQASKGSGLGLALVAEHVRLLRGRIWVADASTGGAEFVITLPLEVGW